MLVEGFATLPDPRAAKASSPEIGLLRQTVPATHHQTIMLHNCEVRGLDLPHIVVIVLSANRYFITNRQHNETTIANWINNVVKFSNSNKQM
jgi:nitrate reductase NapAB chaperone NapD